MILHFVVHVPHVPIWGVFRGAGLSAVLITALPWLNGLQLMSN